MITVSIVWPRGIREGDIFLNVRVRTREDYKQTPIDDESSHDLLEKVNLKSEGNI